MNDRDDELDRRIRAVLDLARADAPEPTEPASASVVDISARPRRWPLMVGAAAALVAVVGGVLLMRDRDDMPTIVTAVPSSTAVSEPSTTDSSISTESCGSGLAQPYEERGTIHTVVPNSMAVVVTIEGNSVCTGGTTTVSVTLFNRGYEAVDLGGTNLIVASGAEKFVVGVLGADPLAPGATSTRDVQIQVPAIEPGNYFLYVYGFFDTATLAVVGPPVCDVTQLRSKVVLQDGASMNRFQVTRITNVGDDRCVLLRPVWASGVVFGGTSEPIQPQSGAGYFAGSMTPLVDHALDPGESADLWTTTSSACLDGVVQSKVYDFLDVQLGLINDQQFVAVGSDVDVACGLWISDWAEPTAE